MVITAPSFFITYVSTAIHLIEFRAYKDNNYSLVSVLYSYDITLRLVGWCMWTWI